MKNLWEQFHRPANVYFLGISILQCIEAISITGGTPTTLAPLTAVLIVSAQQAWNRGATTELLLVQTTANKKPASQSLLRVHE